MIIEGYNGDPARNLVSTDSCLRGTSQLGSLTLTIRQKFQGIALFFGFKYVCYPTEFHIFMSVGDLTSLCDLSYNSKISSRKTKNKNKTKHMS